MQQRETTTDRLADVIDVIKFGRRTGTLTVERGENVTFEEGMIVFIYGQIAHAVVGSRTGQEALRWLNTWGACRFRFTFSDATNSMSSPNSSMPPRQTTSPLAQMHNGMSSNGTSSNGMNNNGERQEASIPVPGVPYRTKLLDNVLPYMEPMGLSRTHKRLFLLVDGQRTVAEIARLMGKKPQEIQEYIDDLINADFVRL